MSEEAASSYARGGLEWILGEFLHGKGGLGLAQLVEPPSLGEFKALWMWHLGPGSVLALAVLGNSWTSSERAFPILKAP